MRAPAEVLPNQLNEEQRRAHDIVVNNLRLWGTAGTGKSWTIRAIYYSVKRLFADGGELYEEGHGATGNPCVPLKPIEIIVFLMFGE